MRLLPISQAPIVCTTKIIPAIMEKTVSLGRDIILVLRTRMRTMGSIYYVTQHAMDSPREIWEE